MSLAMGDGATILGLMRDGERVFMGGSTAEIPAISDPFFRGEGPALDLTASFVPGINPVRPEAMPEGATLAAAFPFGPRGSQAAGRMRHVPLGYRAAQSWIGGQGFETVLAHVSPPDEDGDASLGLAAEFMPAALEGANRIIAIVNPRMPRLPNAPVLHLDRASHVFEIDAPLRHYDVGEVSGEAEAIARAIAVFVPDGAALQIGLGKVPDALLRRLTGRRGLRLWSGMLSDGTRGLHEAGALDAGFDHHSCVHVGTEGYYDWLADRADFTVAPCGLTHSPARLAELGGLVAVNGAIEVDLFGQANLETIGGRAVSGVGGAADFARAAALDPKGVSIIGLPGASRDGTASRIVAALSGPVSLPRHDVEIVVTETGTADLRGLSTAARAERLIAIARPGHRAALSDAWREIVARL